MNIQISLKKLLSIAFISMTIVTVPAISPAHERGHRDNRHYEQSYNHHNYKHKKHNYGHNKYKHSKHNHNYSYDKHRKHHYSSNEYLKPRYVAALHRKGVFIRFYD